MFLQRTLKVNIADGVGARASVSDQRPRDLRNQQGAVAVEFALVLPILIMLLFGIYQFGIAYNNYLSISHAAREGARMAATGNYDQATVISRAYPANVKSVSVSYPSGQTHGQPVQVQVTADVLIEIPFVIERTVTLSSRAEMRLEV